MVRNSTVDDTNDCAHRGGPLSTGMSETRGVGDRWLAGQPGAGVRFGQHQRVEIVEGPQVGVRGTVALLMSLTPEPIYLVTIPSGDVRVRQSRLRAFTSD
jgi:hypothetical protein